MEEFLLWLAMEAIEAAVQGIIDSATHYIIRKVYDTSGRFTTQILYQIDSDGDGVLEDEVLYSFNTCLPNFDSSGCCLVNSGDEVGYGMPMYKLVDSVDVVDFLEYRNWLTDETELKTISGNDQMFLVDYDFDGDIDDVLIPFDFDVTGDGRFDWGLVVDDDDNGIPDASVDFPFYPVGSPEFHQIVEQRDSSGKSIIVVSPDGDITIYDTAGNVTAEEADTAYSIWASKYGIMSKPLSQYSVTEGILLIGLVVASFGFVFNMFRPRRVIK